MINQGIRNKVREYIECIIICALCIFLLIASCLLVTGYTMWIVALVNGKNININNNCPNSKLWEWLLVYGVIIFISICYYCIFIIKNKNLYFEYHKVYFYLTFIITNLVLCFWGRKELEYKNECIHKMYNDTLFYKICLIYWWFDFISICIIFGVLFIYSIKILIQECNNVSNRRSTLNSLNTDLIQDLDSDDSSVV